ncbi:CDC48 family AAA ATPase [Anaerobacterium chartisolvens]|nr:CDC48 family AAA ATPase [Anaerobacterium chartisolvens]
MLFLAERDERGIMGEGNQLLMKVREAGAGDAGRGVARIHPEDMAALGASVGDIVVISGSKSAAAKILPGHKEYRSKSAVQIDGIIRENAGVGLDDRVSVKKAVPSRARSVVLAPVADSADTCIDWDPAYIARLLEGLAVMQGNTVRAALFGSKCAEFKVVGASPGDVSIICPDTAIIVESRREERAAKYRISYEDIGGLHVEIQKIREMIELPLRYPEIFERLGIAPPNGVLLHGPPGTGKTLIARAAAAETRAYFIAVNGPEIMNKFYGESEAQLRSIFEEAAERAPSIIFIDEIDAIAPKRTEVSGEVEKRVVGQLLALMDGMEKRRHVVVIGATNIPEYLDPAFRRPGRFDREISVSVPDKQGRREILDIYTRGMPLSADIDLTEIAGITHGFVGADLEALCREAGMLAMRKILPGMDFHRDCVPYETLLSLEVNMDHFMRAMGEIEPSAIREVFVEIPNVMWQDIGGLEDIKDAIKKSIEWPLKYPDLFRHVKAGYSKGILLTGPPGTGKTLIAKAAASASNANFISVKGPALFSKWVGESEKRVREVFRKAKQAAPCIIFFDEIDALSCQEGYGGNDSGVGRRVISQLLAEMDGVEELKGVIVLAATNRIDLIDAALLRQGRFDEIFEIFPPDYEQRCKIFDIHLRGRPIAGGVCTRELAFRTEGLVGADISGICKKAAVRAIDRFLKAGGGATEDVVINNDDLSWAIEQIAAFKKTAHLKPDSQ